LFCAFPSTDLSSSAKVVSDAKDVSTSSNETEPKETKETAKLEHNEESTSSANGSTIIRSTESSLEVEMTGYTIVHFDMNDIIVRIIHHIFIARTNDLSLSPETVWRQLCL
jgi:hypothetical protein